MRMAGILSLLCLPAWGMVTLPAIATAEYRDSIDRTFEVRAGGTLDIESDLGSITITTHAEPTVTLHIVREIDSNDSELIERLLDNLDIAFEQRGADVSVQTKFHRHTNGFFAFLFDKEWIAPRLTCQVEIPREYNIDFALVDGDITIGDVTGMVHCQTVDGDIELENITGAVEAKTIEGDILITGISGALSAGSVDGDLTVVMSKVTGDDPLSFSSVDGDIDVTLPPETAAFLNATGVDMDMYTDFEVALNGKLGRNAVRGAINGGGREIRMHTVDGNIYLRKGK